MIPSGKRLIVVLGVHRSGTSTITRALNVLGVNLGDKLLPPVQGENSKGYFEDIDLLMLNVEMLQSLGSDWHCLAPIEPSDVESLYKKGYFLRAVDLLRQKAADVSIFGFKDPRVAKLLPFWHPVFVHCGFDTGYVLVIRNPLSVVQSMAKRNGFSPEKSYMLWLGHVLTSLLHTEEHRRVLVDYDHFLQAPQQDLELIAERLALQIDPQGLQHYQSEFLDEGLRNTVYAVNDLTIDQACPPLIQELYAELIDVSRDNKQLDNSAFHARTALWGDEFNRLKSNLRWIDNLSAQIANLNQSIKVHDEEITDLIRAALEQDQNIFQKSFDPEWYLKKYPDIAASGVDPYLHYISSGVLEGRLPSADLTAFIRHAWLDRLKELNAQLNQAQLLTEAQQLQLAEREKTYSQQLQEIQQAHLAQLALARQQIETYLIELAEREKAHTQQLLQIQQAHEQQKTEQSRQHAEREQILKQVLSELHRELNAMRATYSWRWTAPLRSLATLLGQKDSGSSKPYLSTASEEPTNNQITNPVVDQAPSPLFPLSSTTIPGIFDMPFSHTRTAAATLDELLSYHDERFVHSAYQTLLGRAPDPIGMRYYLARVRAGISKIEIINQLHLSAEGKSRQITLAGLNGAIRRHRWLNTPLLGAVLRLAGVSQAGGDTQQKLRAIENKLAVLDGRISQQFVELQQVLAASLNVRDNVAPGVQKEMLARANKALVSFVMPIYDRTDVLRIAIQSALDQTYKDIEVILITDGSPPETLSVVNEFIHDPRVKIFNYPTSSGNAVRGRNKGILEANGKYIAFLDSDDIAMPDRIELSLPLLESGEADVAYGAWRALLDGTRDIEGLTNGQLIYSPDCDLEMLKQTCVPCQSTVLVRKDLLYQAGFLKPKMKYREDHELWIRLAYFGGRFKSIPHALVNLRLHAGNNELNFKHNDLHWQSLLFEEYTEPALIPKKIAFIVAGFGISGGLVVILKHANYLMSIGHDVLIINVGEPGTPDWAGESSVPIVSIDDKRHYIFEKIDLLFSTFWATCEWLARIPAKRKLYFIQSDERLFYEDPTWKELVADTYLLPYEFVAISGWICEMLAREFCKNAYLVPNGIDTTIFHPSVPLAPKDGKRLRVLIEGPISVPFKGVADAYAAIESLDCEIWIVSSAGKPEPDWRVDRFFDGVAFKEMPKIYSSCDILLKMSRVESFSYPPLEAMACGCAVVVGKVFGSIEYIIDGVNALVVEQADINNAREAVKCLLEDSELRARLVNEGYETVKDWEWEQSFEAMLKVVDGFPSKEILNPQPYTTFITITS